MKWITTDDALRERFKDFTECIYSFGGCLYFQKYYYKDYPHYDALPLTVKNELAKECHARWWKEHSGGISDSNCSADLQ